MSSSSAISSRSRRSGSFTRLPELRLERVAVDAVVVAAELVDEVLGLRDRLARYDPQRRRLAAAAVLLVRVRAREGEIRRGDRPRVLERMALPVLPEDLEDHAASASSARRTHAVSSRETRRKPSRSSVRGPWPVTTARSSSQSGSVYSQ